MLFTSDSYVRFDISDHRKHEKGFTIYKVNYVVYLKGSSEAVKNEVVWKRFSDFQKLHHELQQKHKDLCLKDKFPKFAKATFFKRFEDDVIEERRICAKHLLEFIGGHPALYMSSIFIQFLQCGYTPTDCFSAIDSSSTNVYPSPSSGCASTNTEELCQIGVHEECRQLKAEAAFGVENELTVADVYAAINESMEMSKANAFEGDWRFWRLPVSQPLSVSETHCSSFPHSSSSNVDYVIEADRHLEEAYKYEAVGAYDAAITSLKMGISRLLMGAYGEKDSATRYAVKIKSCKYLQAAEKLHSSLVSRLHRSVNSSACTLARPMSELRAYKVLGIIGKVMLVLNANDNRCYVIKVLQKSPCPVNTNTIPVLPVNVPFMVKLHFYFETDENVFLILQYASGGRLWDLFGSSQLSQPTTPVHWMLQENVYLGRKLINLTKDLPPRGVGLSNFDCMPNNVGKKIFLEKEDRGSSISRSCPEIPTTVCSKEPVTEDDTSTVQLNDFNESCFSESLSNLRVSHEVLSTQSTETAELMRNAQKLLESVSRTLEMSDCKDSKVENDQSAVKTFNMQSVEEHISQQAPQSIAQRTSKSRPSLECCSSSCELAKGHGRNSNLRHLKFPSRHLPETQVRHWAEQLVLALSTIHQLGLVFRDFRPENVLLANDEQVLLSFLCVWPAVDAVVSRDAVCKLYAAPEVSSIFEATPAADWWSLGALLFELITGEPLYVSHPGGVHSHSILTFPDFISSVAQSLITELLRYHPHERLGAGSAGVEEIKSHPFFAGTDWKALETTGL